MSRLNRRHFAKSAAALSAAAVVAFKNGPKLAAASTYPRPLKILDTHQHLWDLDKLKLPWLEGAPEVLKKKFWLDEYRGATKGFEVDTLYMEVDVAEEMLDKEAEIISELSRDRANKMLGAILGGRPASKDFEAYVDRQIERGAVKGIRQVLHGGTPKGYCLEASFVKGIKVLGERGLSFDLCMRPTELRDGYQLAKLSPETRFVIDHCGNADPKAFERFAKAGLKADHDANDWRVSMKQLSTLPNVICKISGIVARAPEGWNDQDLAPIVDYCLDTFGPNRVIFGGDWPVCLLGAQLNAWIESLARIVAKRSEKEQSQLWYENAAAFFATKK
jgi:L-fuconolactonase